MLWVILPSQYYHLASSRYWAGNVKAVALFSAGSAQ